MLIDPSYFTRPPRKIKSLTLGTQPDPSAKVVLNYVQSLIRTYEPMYLEEMFGYGNPLSEYVALKDNNGALYDEEKEKLCKMLKEPCADYVYYQILRETATHTTIEGEFKVKTEDLQVAPITRQVHVWNRMVDINRTLRTMAAKLGLSIDDNMLVYINSFNL